MAKVIDNLKYSNKVYHVPSLEGGTMGQKLNVSRSIKYVLMGVGFRDSLFLKQCYTQNGK